MDLRRSNRKDQALTIIEVLVVIMALLVVVAVALPMLARSHKKSARLGCVNNLKQVYLGFRIWSGDNDDLFPMQVPLNKGGAMEEAQRGNVAPIFQVASNELSTPRVLWCPYDRSKTAATNFTSDFGNDKISYFVGVDAATNYPQSLLTGDDNFLVNGQPVKPGVLELSTNMPSFWGAHSPVDWDDKRHSPVMGNIGLTDGSVSETYFYSLRDRLAETGLATNRLAIP